MSTLYRCGRLRSSRTRIERPVTKETLGIAFIGMEAAGDLLTYECAHTAMWNSWREFDSESIWDFWVERDLGRRDDC